MRIRPRLVTRGGALGPRGNSAVRTFLPLGVAGVAGGGTWATVSVCGLGALGPAGSPLGLRFTTIPLLAGPSTFLASAPTWAGVSPERWECGTPTDNVPIVVGAVGSMGVVGTSGAAGVLQVRGQQDFVGGLGQ